MVGRDLSLFAETSVSSRLGGLCTVPSPIIDQSQSQSQSQTRGGTCQGPRGESQQVDQFGRRQV